MRLRPLRPSDLLYFNIPAFPIDTRIWVLEKNVPIGYGGYSVALGLPHLADLYIYVMPAHRRKGHGTRLLKHVIERVEDPTVTTLSSPVDSLRTPTAQFLHHHHFQIEHVEVELICDLRTASSFEASRFLVTASDRWAADQMRRLYHESFCDLDWYQPYADADEVLDDLGEAGEVLFWQEAGDLVGFVGVRYENAVADIEPLGIVKRLQGRGFGRKMLSATLAYLQSQGCIAAQLAVWEANDAAIGLYRQFGFRPKTKRIFLGLNFREDDVQM